MKIRTPLFAAGILLLIGCKKEIETVNKPRTQAITTDSVMNVVWKTPKATKFGSGSGFCCLYNSIIAFTQSGVGNGGTGDILVGLDKNTGKEVWRLNQIRFLYGYGHCQVDNLLILSFKGIVYAINMLDGTIVWETHCPYNNVGYRGDGDGNLFFVGGKLWKSWSCGDINTGDSTILFSIDPKNGALKRINSWDSKENDLFQFGFTKPVIWMKPNNLSGIGKSSSASSDSILILNSISYNNNTYQQKGDFIAWNLNKNETYFDYRGYQGLEYYNPIVINDDVILFDGWQNLESFNLLNLKTNWKLDLTNEKSARQITYHDGKLITSPNGSSSNLWMAGTISFINPNNGYISKSVQVPDEACNQLFFKNNFMYYGGSKISKVNLTDLKLIWEYESPDNSCRSAYLTGQMAFDSANDLIYMADLYNFYCFKIRK